MNKILLIRNLMLLKRNYLSYLVILIITPMILYLFNILPYLNETSKIWSSIGLWFSSCIISSYIYIYQNINSYGADNRNFLMNSSISFQSLISSNIIVCIFIVFIQLLISYILTLALNNVVLSIVDFILLFANILPIIVLFISIALLVTLFDTLNIGLFICTLIALSIVQFFYLFPSSQNISYDYIPIIGVFLNCASLFNNGPVEFLPMLLMYLISCLFLLTSLITSAKIMEKRNEK